MTFLTNGAVFEISRTSLSNVTLDTIQTDSRGSYVLDGDADCVSAILNYYRTGQLHVPQVCMSVCLPDGKTKCVSGLYVCLSTGWASYMCFRSVCLFVYRMGKLNVFHVCMSVCLPDGQTACLSGPYVCL